MRLIIAYQAFTPAGPRIAALDEGLFASGSDHAAAFLPRIPLRRAA